ncbi:MAG: amidohydrolase [Antricoccus sp.]
MLESTPTIYRASQIVAQSNRGPDPDAFAVTGEQITATGMLSELTDRFPGAEVVDFGDTVVVPGFNDAHAHLAMTAEDVLHLDLSHKAVADIDALLGAIGHEAANTPVGLWLRGSRYDDQKTGPLNRDQLDKIAPDHPVLVTHVAAHWGVVNSAALAQLGIDESTPAPEGGSYDRDPGGRLNGRLVERALMNVALPTEADGDATIPASSPADLQRGLARASRSWNAAGLTSVCDAWVRPDDIAMFSAARAAGDLTLRLGMLLTIDYYDKVAALGIGSGFGDDWLRLLGIKMFVDGAIGGRTCLLSEPFHDGVGTPIQTTPTKTLMADVARVHRDGMRVGVHANGDTAIRLTLDAMEAAARETPRPGLRHRIEHCTVIDDEILRRMKALNVIAVPFAGYAAYHGGALNTWYGPDRVDRMFAHRSFLDAGVTVAASSDYPCGPIEPLLGMQSLVTRAGIDDGIVVGEKQRISAAEALRVFTLESAEACGDAGRKGRIEPGYLADFTVLDANPLTVDPSGIAAIGVRGTYVGGRQVYSA